MTSIGFLPNEAFSQSDSRLSSSASASASKGGKSKSPKGKKRKPGKGGDNSKGKSDKKGKNSGKGGTATPTATLEPTWPATGTSTPESTETPQDTETPESTITLTPVPSGTAVHPATHIPTEIPTVEATATVATTATAAETATSEPTSTATGTSTPEPTETPHYTETPEPTAVIADTEIPEETAAPEDTPEQCLSDEALQEDIDEAAAEAGIVSPDEMTCPEEEELPADGGDIPEIGPLSYVERRELAADGSISAIGETLMEPESWESCSADEELPEPPVPGTGSGDLPEPPVPGSGSSNDGGLPEPPVPNPSPAPAENKPCCFFTYSDAQSGGGTHKPGDGFAEHAKKFGWPPDCTGRTFDCALNANTNPFSVRFCELKGSDKTYLSLSAAAEALKCGAQRHLTLYHANPNYGIKGCNMIRNACKGYTDRPVNSEHVNMGCSVFGNSGAICTAASTIAKAFKRRCDTFKNESFVLTGNTVVNWYPSSTGSCSWRFPDGYATGSNYGTMRKIKVTKDGFISCKKEKGKWVEDARFCGGVEGYLKEGPNRPAGLTCASSFG
jgi:hypothetical protein